MSSKVVIQTICILFETDVILNSTKSQDLIRLSIENWSIIKFASISTLVSSNRVRNNILHFEMTMNQALRTQAINICSIKFRLSMDR